MTSLRAYTAKHQTKIIVLFSALTVAISMGIRQSFGLFLQPISQDLGLGREVFSLAMALQNLIFGLPLLGIVFFSHQIGSFLGVWLAGRLYDSTGSYESVWWMAIALGLAATLLHLPIADRPLQTHQLKTT